MKIILIIIIYVYIFCINDCSTLIIYVVFPDIGKGGPKSLSCYIHRAIKIWNENKKLVKVAKLIWKDKIAINKIKNITKRKKTFIWFQRSNYIHMVNNPTFISSFARILYGPNVTPLKWFSSVNNTYEKYWCTVMSRIYGYVLHSDRVKKQIMKNTNCNSFDYKYYFLKPCLQLDREIYKINEYNERPIDFLIYVKYADTKRKSDELVLIEYLKKKYKTEIIKYGNHSRESLLSMANKSKFVIYFSFYDTGALSLLEMKSMGIWPISHQIEFIEKGYGSYVKELDSDIYKSLNKLDDIYKINYNPKHLAENVYNNLNCIKSLYELVKYIKQSLAY